jgi:NAD(P)H-hydrate epimerase
MMELRPLSREEVREVDRRAIEEYGVAGIVLMENAGRGAAELLLTREIRGPVVICCGKGNNGGDGFVIARHLDLAGIEVRLLLFAEPDSLQGDAAENYRIVVRSGLPCEIICDVVEPVCLDGLLREADWIVDALLGTGVQGAVRTPFDAAINAINRANRQVLAVDLPSGLDCDAGLPLGPCVRATLTATFVSHKLGFQSASASEFVGKVHVVGIGAPRRLLEEI